MFYNSHPLVLQRLAQWLTLGLCAWGAVGAWSQSPTWPTKPISLIVTYPPGGGADAMARLVAPKMAEVLGQNVVVENRPGASGQIGASAVAKAAADGYTLMLDASSFAVNPALFPKLPYDSSKAFKPIGVMALVPNVVLVNAQVPAKNIAELIALAKSRKDAIAYASSGNGSAQHLAGALFESAANVDMVHIPFRGGAPAIQSVFGQYPRGDARHIPFGITDQRARGHHPIVVALEWLLRAPAPRASFSELRDLLAFLTAGK